MINLILAASIMAGGDTIELRDSSEGHVAEVHYVNVQGQESSPGNYPLSFQNKDGLTVSIVAVINFAKGSSAENITVIIPDGLYVAMPETIDVRDGQDTLIQILAPMY